MPNRRAKKIAMEHKASTAKVSGWIKGFMDFLKKDSILEREIERRKDVEDFNTRFANRDRRRKRH